MWTPNPIWNPQFHGQFYSLETQGFRARARLPHPTGSRFLQILAHWALRVPLSATQLQLTDQPNRCDSAEANRLLQAAKANAMAR